MPSSRPYRRSARLVLAYWVIASSWIYTTDRLIDRFDLPSHRVGLIQTYKDLLFILCTGLLLYGVLRGCAAPSAEPRLPARPPTPAWAILILVISACATFGVAGFSLQYPIRLLHTHTRQALAGLVEQDVAHLAQWLLQREQDLRMQSASLSAIPATRLDAHLERLRNRHAYRSLSLVIRNGQPPVHTGPVPPMPLLTRLADRTYRRSETVRRLYPDAGDGSWPLLLATPVAARAERPVGALVVSMDLARPLLPRLRDGSGSHGGVLLRLRQTDTPPDGASGDIRAPTEMFSIRPPQIQREVPGTDWMLIGTVDPKEFETPLRKTALLVALTAATLLLTASMATRLWWRQRNHDYQARHRRDRQHRDLLSGRLDHLSRYASDMILLVAEDGRIVDTNQRALERYGYDASELTARHVHDLHPPELYDEADAQHAATLEHGYARFETVHRDQTGQPFPVEVCSRVLALRDTRYIQSIVRDITKQKRSAAALHEREQAYRALFEANPAPMLVYDRKSLKILAVNDAAVECYGYPRHEFLRLDIRDLRPSEDTPALLAHLEGKGTQVEVPGLWRHRRKDGSVFLVEISSHQMDFEQHRACVVMVHDVTRQVEQEREIRRINGHYALLSGISKAIVRERAPHALLHAACSETLATTEIRVAWIGLLQGERSRIVPAAAAGCELAALPALDLQAEGGEALQGPARAVRENRHVLYRRMAEGVCDEWPIFAEHGCESALAAPLQADGRVLGVLCLYAAQQDYFSNELVELANQMATDIAFALDGQEREAQRRRLEDHYRTLVEQIPAITYRLEPGPQLRLSYISPQLQSLLGHSPEDWMRAPEQWKSFLHPDDRRHVLGAIGKLEAGGRLADIEFRMLAADGREVWMRGQARRVEEGPGQSIQGVLTDISGEKASETQLRLAATAFEHTREGILITDGANRVVAVNQAFTQITGYTLDDCRGRTPAMLASGRHDRSFFQNLWDCLERTDHWQGEIYNRRKSGEVYPAWLSISRVRDADGAVRNYVAVFADVTEHKAAVESIEFYTRHDVLTGLPNRLLLQDRSRLAIDTARASHERTALLLLNLDRFRQINDAVGPLQADTLLQRVASRLLEATPPGATLARSGANEFMLLLPHLAETREAAQLAEAMLKATRHSRMPNDHHRRVSASIGIAVFPDDSTDFDSLASHAEAARISAREAGGDCYRYFTDEMTRQTAARAQLEYELELALERGELELHYQPQYTLSERRMVGSEALVRWRHPQRGLLAPGEFIPVAEESGLIIPLGAWVLDEACRQMSHWQDLGLHPPPVAVNVSAAQFAREDFVTRVLETLEHRHLSPRWLELELTESMLMGNTEAALTTLLRLRAHGLRLSIDDFGTGYSSLSYLKRLPIHKLKIDRAFVRELETDADYAAIVRAIISLARNLKLTTLAEGLETEAQRSFLYAEGCDEAQGYLYCKPLPPHQFETLLRRSAA